MGRHTEAALVERSPVVDDGACADESVTQAYEVDDYFDARSPRGTRREQCGESNATRRSGARHEREVAFAQWAASSAPRAPLNLSGAMTMRAVFPRHAKLIRFPLSTC
ncbi:dimethylmenaquinone methyltransferase [Mycolicibacterium brisbanense]|uniref:Dimethylmenaquinone methyltransferase n=1 Tax=Mycolicibacterium brisbanense TaxID=146020 RepID=A0A117I4M6_9MYCO|nr:hypothetical protein [Mycolicibacterium brisbanense]GAS87124.1 dimethylmenaquinone methyltransferase [Mycolicibacterium brisbanense]